MVSCLWVCPVLSGASAKWSPFRLFNMVRLTDSFRPKRNCQQFFCSSPAASLARRKSLKCCISPRPAHPVLLSRSGPSSFTTHAMLLHLRTCGTYFVPAKEQCTRANESPSGQTTWAYRPESGVSFRLRSGEFPSFQQVLQPFLLRSAARKALEVDLCDGASGLDPK